MMPNFSGAQAVHAVDEDLAKLGPCTACVHMRYRSREDRLDCAMHECGTKADCTCWLWEGRDGTKPKLSRMARSMIADGDVFIHPILSVLKKCED